MTRAPLPIAGYPIAGSDQPTIPWQQYFTGLDQIVSAAPTFPGPEVTLNNAAGQTLTAAQFLAGLLLRTGPAGAFSDTTPTAAQIVALIQKADINSNRMVLIRNGGGGVMTLLAGSGVTLQGTTTIAAGNARFYLVTVTAKTAGAEAVKMRGLITGAM
jgi:hypothetical protein